MNLSHLQGIIVGGLTGGKGGVLKEALTMVIGDLGKVARAFIKDSSVNYLNYLKNSIFKDICLFVRIFIIAFTVLFTVSGILNLHNMNCELQESYFWMICASIGMTFFQWRTERRKN